MALISICFAVYQNEGALQQLYEESISDLIDKFPKHDFELLFVNDGSKDNSLGELKRIKNNTKDSRIKIISFSRNFGQMAAILAGWKHAKGDVVINMAADLQDPPAQCVEMIKEWEAGNEIVISYRKSHSTSRINKLTSKVFYKLLLSKAPPGGFDFTLLDRKALNAINQNKERNRFYQYDILWIGFKVKFIPYEKLERTIGKSQYNFRKRFGNFFVAFLNVSNAPLRFMSILGLFSAFIGFLYALNIFYNYMNHKIPISGWSPIMIVILVIGGLIMVMLGVLGEYVNRLLDEVKHRPQFIIDEVID